MKTVRAVLALAMVAGAPATAAARKAAKKGAAPKITAEQAKAIEELMGDFKWGMSREDVQDAVLQRLRAEYDEKIRKASEQWEQQKITDEREKKIKEIRDSYVRFEGQKTGWDVSLLDKEFGQKNEESMFFRWEQDQRRFFFFYQGRLYKMVVALSQEKFKGKSFAEFADLMQKRYGKAEEIERGLQWPPSGVTVLRAIDHTAFYGNYILVLFDQREAERVAEGRKVNTPQKATRMSEIDEALSDTGGPSSMIDANVVDRVTGRAAEGVTTSSSEEGLAAPGSSGSSSKPAKPAKTSAPPPKKKPKASDDVLEGLAK